MTLYTIVYCCIVGVIMGEPIKGHMTRVDRSRARGQFIHSVQNKSIQVFGNTLTSLLFYKESYEAYTITKFTKLTKFTVPYTKL